jgi:hypothetical protein
MPAPLHERPIGVSQQLTRTGFGRTRADAGIPAANPVCVYRLPRAPSQFLTRAPNDAPRLRPGVRAVLLQVCHRGGEF